MLTKGSFTGEAWEKLCSLCLILPLAKFTPIPSSKHDANSIDTRAIEAIKPSLHLCCDSSVSSVCAETMATPSAAINVPSTSEGNLAMAKQGMIVKGKGKNSMPIVPSTSGGNLAMAKNVEESTPQSRQKEW